MIIISGSDKLVIAYIQAVADTLDCCCYTIHELLGSYTCFFGLLLYLLTVLIRTCLEEHVKTLLPLMSCNSISHHYLIRITDMRFSRGVCYRCC